MKNGDWLSKELSWNTIFLATTQSQPESDSFIHVGIFGTHAVISNQWCVGRTIKTSGTVFLDNKEEARKVETKDSYVLLNGLCLKPI